MQSVGLLFPLFYAVFVVGICAYLLSRGVNHLFVILFAVGAVLHAIPTLGLVVLQKAPGGLTGNANWFSVLAIFGVLGTLASVAAFLSLAAFLLRTRAPEV